MTGTLEAPASVRPSRPGAAPYVHLWPLVLILPTAAVLAAFLLFLANMVTISLYPEPEGPASLANYERMLTSAFFYKKLWLSVRLAAFGTVISLMLGYPVALFMTRARRLTVKLVFLFLTVLFFSDYVMRMYAIILAFGNNGFINQALIGTGFVDAPVSFLYREHGVVIGLVAGNLAFMIFALYPVLSRIKPDYAAAASLLGASPFRQFLHVTLPLSVPGIVAGSALVFLMALNSYITPALLGGGFIDMIANLIFEQAINTYRLPLAAASSTILLFLTLAALVGLSTLGRLWRRGLGA